MTARTLSARDEAALDRPIWSALTSKHRSLALGGERARRYPADIAPFAAVADVSPDAVSDLRALAADGPVALQTLTSVDALDGFAVKSRLVLRQMIALGAAPDVPDVSPVLLGEGDVPAMLDLTALTKPGPFFPRTHQLGRYIGIRDGGRLAAMAGERMRLDGHTEISAVCVHPDYRGKGYAQLLMKSLMRTISERGETPFLHVFEGNLGAIALYERLGFAIRTTLHLAILQRLDAAG
jgi:ribosomal protein S18 acetylase RimI-like enzyme